MFREDGCTPMTKEIFGAGSTILMGNFKEYLVVATNSHVPYYVGLVDMQTFRLLNTIEVVDQNYLSVSEVVKLTDPLNCAHTDLDYISEGLKK